jgi:ribulose 1,5-bisphosphate synthetase/thiazole synthase
MRNGEISFWHASLGGAGPTRPALSGPTEADVCVVGAGYTGLWTAWALRRADPAMRIVVIDRAHVGFGASGRNGGWLSGSCRAIKVESTAATPGVRLESLDSSLTVTAVSQPQ